MTEDHLKRWISFGGFFVRIFTRELLPFYLDKKNNKIRIRLKEVRAIRKFFLKRFSWERIVFCFEQNPLTHLILLLYVERCSFRNFIVNKLLLKGKWNWETITKDLYFIPTKEKVTEENVLFFPNWWYENKIPNHAFGWLRTSEYSESFLYRSDSKYIYPYQVLQDLIRWDSKTTVEKFMAEWNFLFNDKNAKNKNT